MSCPFSTGTYMLSCGASLNIYVPSSGEINEYCSDGKYEQYRLCGYYRRAVWGGLAPAGVRRQGDRGPADRNAGAGEKES